MCTEKILDRLSTLFAVFLVCWESFSLRFELFLCRRVMDAMGYSGHTELRIILLALVSGAVQSADAAYMTVVLWL